MGLEPGSALLITAFSPSHPSIHPPSFPSLSRLRSLSLSLSVRAAPSPDVDKATLATNQAGMPVLAALPPIHP